MTNYYFNKSTGVLLTEEEYNANVRKIALEIWEEIKVSKEEQEENGWYSLEAVEQTLFENESDFVPSDENGNKLKEW
ncbi:hypothetical protein HCA41_04230 [Listeria seeligeri]|uniref:hypothetical protein n=1 Tax=Listeria seeligeri TaxID=1640 RepID=UPI001625BFB7|nr:hypothetical protein [Listeria seeligeri]MBC1831872.1 hypothetical protein [Listeria seeligeri]